VAIVFDQVDGVIQPYPEPDPGGPEEPTESRSEVTSMDEIEKQLSLVERRRQRLSAD